MGKRFVSVALVLVIAVSALGEVRLPSIMGSNMVLQREALAPIWGWADPGEAVKVAGSWQDGWVKTKADSDGKWMVRLQTPAKGDDCKVVIEGSNRIELENVLIGEVWVASGQSNMQWAVSSSNNAEDEIAAAKYPKIRLFYVTRATADTPQDDCEGSWQVCSPETVGGFSAVAYFFGRTLHRELGAPIGLINTSWGGTPAESWTRRAALEADEDFVPILERFDAALKDYPAAQERYKKTVEKWEGQVKAAKEAGKNAPRKPRFSHLGDPGHPHRPSTLYNAMIAPLIPYNIAGAIWYQGESNAGRSYQYRTLFPAMIENWRDDWGYGDFPFYFVQIAPFRGQTPEIREAQLIALRTTANTGMAVTMDIGNPDNIHPKNKQDVGKRLALWALAKDYGEKNIVYSGPLYTHHRIEGSKIRLFFEHCGSGLVADGGSLTHFVIAEKEGEFVPAKAKIEGDTVVVWSDGVKEPAAARYGWENAAEPNLFNKEGLPASPFRTDKRPGETYGKY